jgi:sulfate adenylyltransferase
MPDALPAPYGGSLINPTIDVARAPDRLRVAARGASLDLDADHLARLELILSGAYSPLRGYMTRENAERCRDESRLADGTLWPVPLTLAVPEALARGLVPRTPLVLRDLEGVPLAMVSVDEVWQDPDDAAGREGGWRVSGLVEGLQLPVHHDFTALRHTPATARAAMSSRGWTRALAVPMVTAPSVALIAATQDAAARLDAGLLVVMLVPPVGPGDGNHFDRVRASREAFAAYPADRAILVLLSWPLSGAPKRDWLARAIVARNFGCTHCVVPAGLALPELGEIGVGAVALDLQADSGDERSAGLDPVERRGFTLLLTGLSGSGKSTIAKIIRVRLQERGGRRVSLLDGDLVRKHLSSELGFSREHRDLNVRRIAYVASEITRHGGIAICAPIAPYEAVRREARRMVEEVGDFILVFVDTPLAVCEARDAKGLYARARAGLIPSFTGISDPYERPEQADIVLDTTRETADQAADRVMAVLAARGYFGTGA